MIINTPANPYRAKSILIVDDSDIMLDVLTKAFERSGLEVFIADNGLDGWDIFIHEHIDIVLTDIRMPGMDGIELAHRIRDASPTTIIALMTGGPTDQATDLLKDGFVDHLFIKPFELRSVCETLLAKTKRCVISECASIEDGNQLTPFP